MKLKILYITPTPYSGWLKSDAEFFKKHYEVKVIIFDKLSPFLVFKIFKGVLWADVTFSWFADMHAFLAVRLSKIFRKKAIVVVGGYEVAKVPEIELGAMLNPKSARRVEFILEKADKILAVSEFNKKEILKYTDSKNVELIYNGVDYNYFIPKGDKEDLVMTAAVVDSWRRVRLKGLDTFVKSAKFLSDMKFLMIGIQGDALKKLRDIAPSNVGFIEPLPQGELIPYYQKAKVYCQLSYRESFGMASAEAMSCGCVPVVTDRAALPEVVGDTGFYVPYDDPEATAEAIKKALKLDKGKKARERIKGVFPLEKREKELIRIIRGV